ncbi:MAG: BrnT family toxin [Flavobacteriaceae bacterium]
MCFEFDIAKSISNKEKHGIDFTEAQVLWDDPEMIQLPAKNTDEPRYLTIGKINNLHWSAIVTFREDKIRIISVRRSRTKEIALYESY